MSLFHLIGYIIFGFVVGVIARLLTPGHRHRGLLITSGLGIAGSLLAGWLGHVVGWYGPDDGAGYLAATLGAIVVLSAYQAIVRRRSAVDRVTDRDYPSRAA